ncbi:MAG: hypothetical protein WAK60_08140 [Sedimentisphaerales bacterium]
MKINKKQIIIISAMLIGFAAGSVVWRMARRAKPANIAGQKPEQIFEYLRSDEFGNLDPNTRREYAQRVFRQMMTQHAKEYCELPPEKRTAYLDGLIDNMQSQRREFESQRMGLRRPRDGEQDRRPPRQRGRPENMRARRELIDPTSLAQMAAFRRAMAERMGQRGMTPRGRPPQ